MKKILSVFTAVSLTALSALTTGCINSSQIDSSSSNTISTTKTPSETAAASLLRNETYRTFEAGDDIDVVFVGNSLMRVDELYQKVEYVASAYGYNMTAHEFSRDGFSISEHIYSIEIAEALQITLAKADVVIFQEYGGCYDTTYDDIREIVSRYCPNAEIYYFTTDFDYLDSEYNTYYSQIANDPDIHIIPAGTFVESVTDDGQNMYSYSDLHLEGDYHPNDAQGWLVSLLVFCEITGQRCIDYPNLSLSDNFFYSMKGDGFEQKSEWFYKIYRDADELIATHENLIK